MVELRTVAVLLFEGVNALDVAGPLEAFSIARCEDGLRAYAVESWALHEIVVRSESGLRLVADGPAPAKPRGDILLIPGGAGGREDGALDRLAGWLKVNEAGFARIAAVCTGAYVLAASGLVDGREIATHWAFADDLQRRYPSVKVAPDALFLRDGRFHSSGGVTAGIDLALDFIAKDVGERAAMEAARRLVVYMRRAGAQAQFSMPLELQSRGSGRIDDVCLWAAGNLDKDLSVEALATRAGVSARQFSRRFKEAFGAPPAAYVKRLRLDAARTMLAQGVDIPRTAHAVGFQSQDGFRRAFEEQFAVTPREYQKRFRLNGVDR